MKLPLGPLVFSPTLWPTLAMVFFLALTLSLGNWQTRRATEKRDLQTRLAGGERAAPVHLGSQPVVADALLFRRVEARGIYVPEAEILLDNRIHDGVAGYYVLTPLLIDGGKQLVLVNRGWLAAGQDRRVLPVTSLPVGRQEVVGVAVPLRSRYFEFSGAAPAGKLWQNLDVDRYAGRLDKPLQPVLLQQIGGADDGLVRDWPRPDTGVAMHESYALQWYGLAATLLVLYFGLNLKRREQ
jgi:surfeit locus 1 family protein